MGGKGTMVGTMLGALIIAVLRNGFSLLSVSSAVQNSYSAWLSSAPYCSTLLVSAWLLRLAVWLLSNQSTHIKQKKSRCKAALFCCGKPFFDLRNGGVAVCGRRERAARAAGSAAWRSIG